MKKEYFKPEVIVVTVNLHQPLLDTSPSDSPGPSADFMSDPTISRGSAVKRHNVWDDDWSN